MNLFLEIDFCSAESLLLIKSAGSHFSLSLVTIQNQVMLPTELKTLVYFARGLDTSDLGKRLKLSH